MENRIKLIKGNGGEITGVKAYCNGEYTLPTDKLDLPREDFAISSEDAGILLAQYNPEGMFYLRDSRYGIYYMHKENEYNSKLKELIEKVKEQECDLKEAYKTADSRADRLVECLNRVKYYSEMYKKIPKWLRRFLFSKYDIAILDAYEKSVDRL